MKMRIFVSRDAGAIAVGADDVVAALEPAADKRGLPDRDRQDRIARALLAGADGRGGDSKGPRRLRSGGPGGRAGPVRCDG